MMSIGLSGPVILGKALNDYHGNNHMVQLIRGPRPSIEDQVAVIDNVLARLNLNDNATKADVMRNTGILADLGFCALLGHHVAVIDGILRYDIIPGIYSLPKVETSTKEDYLKNIKEFCENSLGMDLSKPENVKLAEAVVDIDRWMRELLLKWKNTDPIPAIVGNGGWTPLASDPVPAKSFLASADTRGSGGDDMRDAFAEAFHIDENTYCQTEVNQVFDFLNNFDAKTLNFYLKYYVVANLNNFIYKPEHSAENFLSFIAFSSHSILLDYEKEVFLKRSDCEGARSMLEEMRTLFAQRIQNSTWLSEDTKTQALKKLQNMKFLLGAPERIFNADFKLTGKSPVEDLVQYRGFCDEYLRNVLPGLRGADYQWEYVMLSPIGMGLSAGNAFYDPSTNQLCILPAFLGEEMFPQDKNDIFRYITGWVFAHEMTHGFDGNGAKYDYEGRN